MVSGQWQADPLVTDHWSLVTDVMSRIGRMPVAIPKGAKVSLEGRRVTVHGPGGELFLDVPGNVTVKVSEQVVEISRSSEEAKVVALHGLCRALISNMVQGVTSGFSKQLEVTGVGYRAQIQDKRLSLHVGFSHPVHIDIPEGISVETPKPTVIIVKGRDKQQVGQFAANVHQVAPPEPYKGKGIKYAGEVIRRKAGKAATGAKAG